jgi:hypothetical protein
MRVLAEIIQNRYSSRYDETRKGKQTRHSIGIIIYQ